VSENNLIYDPYDGKTIIISNGYLGIYKDNSKKEGFGYVVTHGNYDIGVFFPEDDGKAFGEIDYLGLKIETTKDEMGNTKYKMNHNDYQEDNFELLCLVPMIKLFPKITKVSKRELSRMLSYVGYKLGLVDKTSYLNNITSSLMMKKFFDEHKDTAGITKFEGEEPNEEFEHKLDQSVDEKEIEKIKQNLKLVNNERRNIMENINNDSVERPIDVRTDFGKGMIYYSCDGKKFTSLEQVMQYNELFYEKMKIKKQEHLYDIKSDDSLLTDIKPKSL